MSNFLTIDQLLANCTKLGGDPLTEQHASQLKTDICKLFKEIYGPEEPIRIHAFVEEAPRFLFHISLCGKQSTKHRYIRHIRTLLKYNNKSNDMYTKNIVESLERDIGEYNHRLKKELGGIESAKNVYIVETNREKKEALDKNDALIKKCKDLENTILELKKDLCGEQQITQKYKEKCVKMQDIAKEALVNISKIE